MGRAAPAALFTHFTSRENDPQWHIHCIVPNVTWDPVEGRYKALQASEIFANSAFLTEIFRNIVQRKLRELGYETIRTGKGIEIVGVTRKVIKTFSKRHTQIEEIAETLGGLNNYKLRAEIAHKCRAAKDTSKTLDELREGWRKQLSRAELDTLDGIKAAARGPLQPKATVTAEEALAWSARHNFERRSVVRKNHLLRDALKYSNGYLTLDDLRAALQKNASGEFGFDDRDVSMRAPISSSTPSLSPTPPGSNAPAVRVLVERHSRSRTQASHTCRHL